MSTAAKILVGAVAVILLGWAAAAAAGRAIRGAVRDEMKVAALDSGRVKLDSTRLAHDSGYQVDSVTYRVTRTRYDTLRKRLVLTDTVRIEKVLLAADSALKQCDVVIRSCEQRVADRDAIIRNRDSLVAELKKPVSQKRFIWATAALYDPLNRTALVRAGPELRLFSDFSATAEGAFDQQHGFAVRLGLRKTF